MRKIECGQVGPGIEDLGVGFPNNAKCMTRVAEDVLVVGVRRLARCASEAQRAKTERDAGGLEPGPSG